MTNEQILKKAIEKAINNGWEGFNFVYASQGITKDPDEIIMAIDSIETEYGVDGTIQIIFSHDFAKAFWGEGKLTADTYIWQQRLIEMVLDEEPLKYIEKFL